MKRVTQVKLLLILLCNLIVFNNVLASEKKVFYAGFSFSGNYIDKSSSIQFTNQLINEKDENGIVMCRDCKKMPSEIGSHNCYHISKGNICCYVCTIS